MTGTTASGWPYVLPADHPKEFPAHSQALANKLQAAVKLGLTIAYKGADQFTITSGTAAGFSTSMTVEVGRSVLALVNHVGSGDPGASHNLNFVPTGATLVGTQGPQFTIPSGWIAVPGMVLLQATAATVSLTYNISTSIGTWACGRNSTIILVGL